MAEYHKQGTITAGQQRPAKAKEISIQNSAIHVLLCISQAKLTHRLLYGVPNEPLTMLQYTWSVSNMASSLQVAQDCKLPNPAPG